MSTDSADRRPVRPAPMPKMECGRCYRVVWVDLYSRAEFPPDAAKRKLRRECKAAGCPCDPIYTAGVR